MRSVLRLRADRAGRAAGGLYRLACRAPQAPPRRY